MRRTLFSLLLAGLLPFCAPAQPKGLYLGLQGGLSIPSLKSGETKNDWNKNYESRLGPYFGILAELQITRHLSFQPELNYAAEGGRRNGIQPMSIPEEYLQAFQQGLHTDKDYVYADLKSVSRINYILLPLQLKYTYPLALKGRFAVFAQAGPNIGYMVMSKQVVKAKTLRVYLDDAGTQEIPPALVKAFFGTSVDTTLDAKDELHRWNVGIQGALGFSLQLGKSKIFIEGGGNYGFIPIQKSDAHGKNNIGAATIAVGYAMNIR